MSVYGRNTNVLDGWPATRLVFDQRELHCFCCRTSHNVHGSCSNWHCRDDVSRPPVRGCHSGDAQWPRFDEGCGNGEFSSCDLTRSLTSYQSLSIDCAMQSHNPLHHMLAILDGRFGKRRIRALDRETLHPIAFESLRIRVEAEGMDERTAGGAPRFTDDEFV